MIANKKTKIKGEYRSCPFCGSPKTSYHKLDDGTFGIWCDECLSGIVKDSTNDGISGHFYITELGDLSYGKV